MSGSGKRPKTGFRKLPGKFVMHGGKKRQLYRHAQHGMGFFSNLWDGIKNAGSWVYNKVLKPVHQFAKDNKLYSKALALIPHPAAKAASVGVSALGGKKKKQKGNGKSSSKSLIIT
jgi:hypothetical protein